MATAIVRGSCSWDGEHVSESTSSTVLVCLVLTSTPAPLATSPLLLYYVRIFRGTLSVCAEDRRTLYFGLLSTIDTGGQSVS